MERDSAGRFRGRRDSQRDVQRDSQQRDCPPEARRGPISATTGLLSLIGGAAVGAVAMYLMDPNHGEERRARALEAAHRALEVSGDAARTAYQGTAHALGHAWDAASEKASDVGSAAYAAMPSSKDVRKGGARFMDRAYDMGA